MLADQHACSPRNVRPGQLFLAPSGGSGSSSGSGVDANLQAPDVEVDYRGREVGVDSVLRVLTGVPRVWEDWADGFRKCGKLGRWAAGTSLLGSCCCQLAGTMTSKPPPSPPSPPAPPGHHAPGTPASKRLRSGPASHVLLYLTGHGGDEFLKFHDEVGGCGWWVGVAVGARDGG